MARENGKKTVESRLCELEFKVKQLEEQMKDKVDVGCNYKNEPILGGFVLQKSRNGVKI